MHAGGNTDPYHPLKPFFKKPLSSQNLNANATVTFLIPTSEQWIAQCHFLVCILFRWEELGAPTEESL